MEEKTNTEIKESHYESKKTFNITNLKNKFGLNSLDFVKWKSCNDLTNFVPKITPKKSYCVPTLLILNPDVIQKKNSDEICKKKLFFESESDDNSFELSFESPKEEENKNLNDEAIINNDININIKSENLANNLKDDFNLENKSKSDFKERICNNYDSGEYLTILDILSMNKDNIG